METYNITWENFGGTWSKYYRTNSVVTAKVEYNETFEGVSYESINGWLDYAVADKMVVCSGDFNATSGTRSGVLYVYLDGELETEVHINQKAKNVIIRDLASLKVTSLSKTVNWQGNSKFRIYVNALHIQNLQCTTSNVDLDATGYYINIPENKTSSTKTYTVTFKGNSTIVPENIKKASCVILLTAVPSESISLSVQGNPISSKGGSATITINANNIVLSSILPDSSTYITKNNSTSWSFTLPENTTISDKTYTVTFSATGAYTGNTLTTTATIKQSKAELVIPIYAGCVETVPTSLNDCTPVYLRTPFTHTIHGGNKCMYIAFPNNVSLTGIFDSNTPTSDEKDAYTENALGTGYKTIEGHTMYYLMVPGGIPTDQYKTYKFSIK